MGRRFWLGVCLFPALSIPAPGQTSAQVSPKPAKDVKAPAVWLTGTVRDTTGNPVADAAVMVLGTFQGSIRRYQVTSRATTDSLGHYEVKGEGGLPYFSGTVLATAPGHAPAWAWPAFPQIQESFRKPQQEQPSQPPPPVQDLVLPSTSGGLQVTILQDGKPAPGVTVAVYLENANLRDVWARPMGDASAIQNAAYPMTTTNADGIAAFNYLLPGSYRIVATSEAKSARAIVEGFPDLRGVSNEVTGVPVQVGKTSTYKMSIWKQDNRAVLKVLKTDGTQLTTNTAMSFGPVDTIGWSTTPQFDPNGFADLSVSHSGLWRVDVMYRDAPITSFPISEPYFRATGHVASSPSLPTSDPPVTTARWVDAGSARIFVRDIDGKPLRVTVHIANAFAQEGADKITDEHGEVVFSGLRNGVKYFVGLADSPQTKVERIDLGKFVPHPGGTAFVTEDSMPWLHRWDRSWEHAQEIRAQPAVMERTFIARQDHQTTLVMPVVPMTYVYGQVKIPPGKPPYSWVVWVDYTWQRRGVTNPYFDDSGDYILGPFPPGQVTLNVDSRPGKTVHPSLTIAPHGGEPVRFDIDPSQYSSTIKRAPASLPDPTESVSLGMGGISAHAGGTGRLTGSVYLADGVTPALGAQVLYFPAGIPSPRLIAVADALGTLQPRGLWYTGSGRASQDVPDTAAVVALLPGSSGATVQTVPQTAGEQLRIVLPQPVSVSGEIKVGGKPIGDRQGSLHVIAAFKGKGFLRPYLNVETTADTDGNFTLAGLTPGDYLVQASLDNLWLSETVPMHVEQGSTKPLSLAIPAPGVPLRMRLLDAGGKPVAGGTVAVERSGPLSYLWPASWTADGAGSIEVPTLETGWHVIWVPGTPKPLRVWIPALPGKMVDLAITLAAPPANLPENSDPDIAYSPN